MLGRKAIVKNPDTTVAIPPDTIISGILQAATNPDVDIDKMERLMAMHERLISEQNEARFTGAMNKAQGEMRRVEADLYNEQTKSKYASYAALDRSLRPIYTANGFNLSHEQVTAGMIADCHAAGLPVAVYTVNEPDRMRAMIELGVDILITDRPDRALRIVLKQ